VIGVNQICIQRATHGHRHGQIPNGSGLIGIIILLMAGIGSSCLGSPSLSMEHSEARDDYIDVKNPNRNLAVFES
jgi:hypothetical protein